MAGTVDVDAGTHHVVDSAGKPLGYRWFAGSTALGHLGPAGDPTTSAAVTNAIIVAAHTSEAAMLAAMPSWLVGWYQGLPAMVRARFYLEMSNHPGVL